MKINDQFIPLAGFLVILVAALVWTAVREVLSFPEMLIIACASLLLYTILVWLLTWFHIKPRETFVEQKSGYEEIYLKIKATVDKLIQKQRFIDQGILNIIEREAEEKIWVVTTKLANELENKELQKAVENNLAEGKYYTYFLPHPDDVNFRLIERNLKKFKRLRLYEKYKGQIDFIRLPLESQFLLDEVVIYNPEKQENPHDATKGINGFTYYDCKNDPDMEGPMHMKIDGHLLSFLCERLDSVLRNTGLKSAVEIILTEFANDIDDTDKLYLVNLLSCRSICNKDDYTKFIHRVSDRNKDQAKFIDQILSKYLDP